MRKILLIIGLFVVSANQSCKKFVEVEIPNNRLAVKEVYSLDATSIGVFNALYSSVSSNFLTAFDFNAIPLLAGIYTDEMNLIDVPDLRLQGYYKNSLDENTISGYNPWYTTYQYMFTVNDAIEGLSGSTTLSAGVRNQLLGEAKFMRAFFYFYLTNMYGKVPLILTTDYKKNSTCSRAPEKDVYAQIIADLIEAENLLSDHFLDGTLKLETAERVRPTKWAASALLSRVYLYTGNWMQAEIEASKVINNVNLFKLDPLKDVFVKNSNEAIWQIQGTNGNYNTVNANFFIIPDGEAASNTHPAYLSTHLINSFEVDDNRLKEWVGLSISGSERYYYPFKYKENASIKITDPLTEYYMMLRLSEQYLIRAEARAQQGNYEPALEDLKKVRSRAGLETGTSANKEELLEAIMHERQVELFAEWGDRWFDLRRTNKLDDVMSEVTPEKGGIWSSYRKYLPVSAGERKSNPNILQTDGY